MDGRQGTAGGRGAAAGLTHILRRIPICVVAAWIVALAAGGSGQAQERPGKVFEIRPSDMPRPYATRSVGNSPDTVRRPTGAVPWAPPGYDVNLFADGLDHARWLAVAETGEVFLSESRAGKVTLLIDTDGDGKADKRSTFTDGHHAPHGLALHDGNLYVADLEGVWRYPWQPGAMKARGKGERITPRGAFGDSGGHWTRNIAIAPDGQRFYAAIGSEGNIDEEPAPRATVKEFRIDGSGGRVFTGGLRNPVGIAFHPDTGALYTVVNERDGMGDGLVPDYMAAISDGAFFGWPYAYIGPNPQPDFADRRPDLVMRTALPDVLFESHSAPMAVLFAKGGNFPKEWQDDAFVALRGSWNAAVPTGYKVVRIPFENGRPTGAYENFVTGFRLDQPGRRTTARVWGRPVGLALLPDGSMLIAVDVDQSIWRISRKAR